MAWLLGSSRICTVGVMMCLTTWQFECLVEFAQVSRRQELVDLLGNLLADAGLKVQVISFIL